MSLLHKEVNMMHHKRTLMGKRHHKTRGDSGVRHKSTTFRLVIEKKIKKTTWYIFSQFHIGLWTKMPIQRWIPSMWLMCLASIVDIMSFIFSSWDCSHKQDFPWNSKDLLTTLCSKINTRDVSKGDHVLFVDVNLLWIRYRNIIQIHSNVPWDWQHSTKYSPHLDWTWGILCRILSIPRNIVMYVNNVMKISITYATKFPLPFWRAIPFNTVLNVVASGQDRSPQMSFILKGSQKLALQLNV